MDGSRERLEDNARAGDLDAQIAIGRRCEAERNTGAARAWFARAAKQGSAAAMRHLAINLLSQEPVASDSGVNMMRAAADQGDAEAACLCANLAAADLAVPTRWQIARQCLEIAAERGSDFARAQLAFLAANALEFDDLGLPTRPVFESPRIALVEGCVSKAECDWLIARARPRLTRAEVYDTAIGGGRVEEARTNSGAEFGIVHSDLVLMRLRARIAAIMGLRRLEASAVLHYAPGQEFKPHFDFLDSSQPGHAMDMRRRGQRVATFLVYLNDDFEGGETDFPTLGFRYKGKSGDALLFWNVEPSGRPDRKTFHAGLPPTKGEKWLFSQWLRNDPPLAG